MRGWVGVQFPGKKNYEGVRFNVISVTRGWVGVKFAEKALRNTWMAPSFSGTTYLVCERHDTVWLYDADLFALERRVQPHSQSGAPLRHKLPHLRTTHIDSSRVYEDNTFMDTTNNFQTLFQNISNILVNINWSEAKILVGNYNCPLFLRADARHVIPRPRIESIKSWIR